MNRKPTKTKIALRFLLAGAICLLPAICFVEQKSITEAQSSETKRDKPELVVQRGHSFEINSVTFSPDGKILASAGGRDMTIKLWDVETRQLIRSLVGHTDQVGSVIFSSNGKTLFSTSADNTVKVWSVENGQIIKSIEKVGFSVQFFSDGRKLAYQTDNNKIKIWNFETGQQIMSVENSSKINSIAFSPNGKILAFGNSDETISLWNIETGRQLESFQTNHKYTYYSITLAFSPDSKTLISWINSDWKIKLWNVETGKLIQSVDNKSGSSSIALSLDGKILAASCYDNICLWNIETGENIKSLEGHTFPIKSIIFSPDGKTLASGSIDSTVKLWNIEDGKQIKSFEGNVDFVNEVAISPNEKSLAASSLDDTIKLWNLETGQKIKSFIEGGSESFDSMAFSPDSLTLAAGTKNDTIKLWNVKTGEFIKSFKGENLILSVAFSPDGKILASGDAGEIIKLWNVEAGQVIKFLEGHKSLVNESASVTTVAFSPDGKILASGSWDKTIKLWNVETGQLINSLEGHNYHLASVIFSPNGKILASIDDRDTRIKLWDVASGQLLKSFVGHTDWLFSIAFSPDGKILASASADRTIKLWNIQTGQSTNSFEAHNNWVRSVTFAQNGKLLLSGGDDGTIKLWNVENNKLLATLISLDRNEWVVTTPDGRFDTNEDLNKIEGLIWVLPDQPLIPKPLELYLRQYYEPGLLTRVLRCNEENNCEQEFKPLPSIAEINRVQPKVEIREVKPKRNSSDLVDVTVDVENFSEEIGGKMQESSVYDLRLFRDGQLVATSAKKADLENYIKLAPSLVEQDREAKILLNTNEDKAWRKANDLQAVVKFDKNKATFVFENVRLPHDGRKEIEFSAYAFNSDRVKSETSYKNFEIKSPTVRKGNTYLISIGVNQSENPAYNLNYAAADAYKTQEILGERLKTQLKNRGSKLVQIELVSDSKDGKLIKNATKPIIKGVFNLLAGKRDEAKTVSSEVPVFVDGQKISAFDVPAVQPEDTLIITYSGHGYADRNGIFYLLPYDIGANTEKLTTANLPKLISSDELSLWMLDVTAKEMLMVVDACHSAAAVQGDGFKPGPMGSRGLGQLAYDKGMKILSATQADNVALELGSLQQGLLSYALLQDGIFNKLADSPKDNKLFIREWLKYGEARVPALYESIKNGTLKNVKIDNQTPTEKQRSGVYCVDKSCKQNVQQPRLFDFNQKRADGLLINLP